MPGIDELCHVKDCNNDRQMKGQADDLKQEETEGGAAMEGMKSFLIGEHSEDGMGVVEVLLIIVVLIGMVIIFQKQITQLVDKIWKAINKDAATVYK